MLLLFPLPGIAYVDSSPIHTLPRCTFWWSPSLIVVVVAVVVIVVVVIGVVHLVHDKFQ